MAKTNKKEKAGNDIIRTGEITFTLNVHADGRISHGINTEKLTPMELIGIAEAIKQLALKTDLLED